MTALAFMSAAELRTLTPPETPWVWGGYLPRGGVALFAAKPKLGKSTLALGLSEAVAAGAPTFLGRAVEGGAVVFVTEEGLSALAHKLPHSERVSVLTRDLAWPKPEWEVLVAGAVEEALRVEAAMLVVDTFAFWAALAADKEKDAGATQAAMQPLVEATRENVGVLLVHHARKGGGEDGEAVRGSSAIAGAVDVVWELERPVGKAPPNQRALLALSRYPETPGSLIYDHDPKTGSWGVAGESEERRPEVDWRARVLDALGDEWRKRPDLEAVLGDAREWRKVLGALIDEGAVARRGSGKKGSPYEWRRLLWRDSVEDATQNHTGSVIVDGAVSAVFPVGEQQNAHHGSNRVEDVEATESVAATVRPWQVWVDPGEPDERLRVVDVDGTHARVRVEVSANGHSGEESRLPLATFEGLGRVA